MVAARSVGIHRVTRVIDAITIRVQRPVKHAVAPGTRDANLVFAGSIPVTNHRGVTGDSVVKHLIARIEDTAAVGIQYE